MNAATHSGSFHADDVLAWALILRYVAPDATLIRTRDGERIAAADLVFDVGDTYDPAALRFDHHQSSYTGPLSSAGMILGWLEDTEVVSAELAASLRAQLVDYVDAVDTGRRTLEPDVPCFATLVDVMNAGCEALEDFDAGFHRAAALASALLDGLVTRFEEESAARAAILTAMQEAEAAGSNLIRLERYMRWQDTYFAHDGAAHLTEFVLMPSADGSWRVLAIPPEAGSFDQKRPLPASWAGLRDAELEAACGVEGARFCHKNRFIAVFDTRAQALEAMQRAGLLT